MSYFLIPAVALFASLLTFFSGFGLGTLLLPAFALFFPVDLAIGLTAIVHFLNNLFKLGLVARSADKHTVFRFGVPAIAAAFGGAWLLTRMSDLNPIGTYTLAGHHLQVLPVKLVVAILMIAFTILELIPRLRNMEFSPRFLPLGGALSGFFGGLSGHQGALRSAFLARSGLSKEQFIGTGVVIACLIDIARISVYSKHLTTEGLTTNLSLLVITTLSAFTGAYFGSRLLKKITMHGIQLVVSASLFLLAIALGMGLI